MTPTLSDHARKRLAERNVTIDEVEQVLRRPIGQPRAGNNGNLVYSGRLAGGRTLDGVVTPHDRNHVVTVIVKTS